MISLEKESQNNHDLYFSFFKKKDFIYLFLNSGEGREKVRDRNITVWLPLMCLLLGTWPKIQECGLTRNRTRLDDSQAGTQSTEPHQAGP